MGKNEEGGGLQVLKAAGWLGGDKVTKFKPGSNTIPTEAEADELSEE